MQFRDRTLLRLLDSAECGALLTPGVGDRLLQTAFTAQEARVGPVTAVVTRQVTLMPTSASAQPLDAQLYDMQSGRQWRLSARWPLAGPTVDADARLDLTLLAGRGGVETTVTHVARKDPVGGGVPDDRGRIPLGLNLQMVEEPAPELSETAFKVVCVAFVLDRPFADLAARLADVQVGMARVAESADRPQPPAGMAVRTPAPALVVFPEAALDDADLPGVPAGTDPGDTAGLRRARLTELATRLGHVGIVPVAVP
ncbi:hypothetical protein [Streptomyces sp. NPDC007369]|uniref:hypothetical protein n=1 Tax=Streptomyces sp. NPDC007369 TaxID=3154589 RepID=UPI0033EA5719